MNNVYYIFLPYLFPILLMPLFLYFLFFAVSSSSSCLSQVCLEHGYSIGYSVLLIFQENSISMFLSGIFQEKVKSSQFHNCRTT